MRRLRQLPIVALVTAALALVWATTASAGTLAGAAVRPLITGPVVEAELATLAGNIRPEANAENDRGAVADEVPLEHMLLQLRRSDEQEEALAALIDQLHDRASPNFHQWLNAGEFGARFGLAAADLQAITGWLQVRGLRIDLVYPSNLLIDFSGTAGQVRDAFHTEIHHLAVNGASHIANITDPQIPAALAPAVVGIVSLNDFRPRAQYSLGNGAYRVAPADLATIYNFNPLFTGGLSGQGQTITLIEDTDLFATSDWTTFRSTFGLSGYSGASLTTIHPNASGGNNCIDPGVVPAYSAEVTLDAEWASAAAPSAAIIVAACADTVTSYGVMTAIQNVINGANPPAIISISYGGCEVYSGAANNAAYYYAYQQGVAEGISIFVSAGDTNAAFCDGFYSYYGASHGINVNALASTPYNVAVGGTDFGDTFSGTNNTYWNAGNTATYGSAKSYIPEIPWNDTCASQLLASYNGFSATYGVAGFCNSLQGQNYLRLGGGNGGPSACATGVASIPGVVSGTCQGYAKPSWQTGVVGIPNDGVRDLPDLSLFAAGPTPAGLGSVWKHAYVFCWSDFVNGGLGCSGAPANWNYSGGTSFGAPIMAGVQALINQKTGQRQGNPNYIYYQLAAAEYGANGNPACDSSKGNAVASSCIFYDVTLGDNDADCTGGYNCYLPSGTYGVLSTSNSSYAPAYKTATGWDFATGVGTINAYNLVTNWNSVSSPYTLTVSVSGGPGGKVTSSPAGIDCGATCSAGFAAGTQVALTASPATAWGFSGWGGGACGGIGSCSVTLNANTSVSASFTTLFTAAQTPLVSSPADIPVLPPLIGPLPQ
jgi:subtilase family serine protease